MAEDRGLSESEVRAVYAPFVERFAAGGIAVKTHGTSVNSKLVAAWGVR